MESSFGLANSLFRVRDFGRAIEAYRSLIQDNPEFGPYYHNLASAYEQATSPTQALRTARLGLCFTPRDRHLRHIFDRLRVASPPRSTGPALSVIVPVHNTQDYLHQCIESILTQDFDDLELIAVDDGSSDRCRSILERFARQDSRVILIRNDKPSGNPGTPRNQALSVARGEYVGFVDSDDWIDGDYYDRLMKAAREQRADIVFAGGFHNHAGDKVAERRYGRSAFSDPDSDFYKFHESFMLWDKVFRRDLIDQFSIRLGETRAAVDVPFIFRAYFHAQAVSCCEDLLGYHYRRETPTSVTVNFRKGSSCDFEFEAYQDVSRWVSRDNVPAYFRKVVDIKRLTSYIYTLGLIAPESFEGFFDRAKQEISRIDRAMVEGFAKGQKKRWVLNGYDAILESTAAEYFASIRPGNVEIIPRDHPKRKFHLEGPKPGIAFFPAWLQANPYQELFYRAVNRATGRRIAGFAPEDLSERLLHQLKGGYEYLHFHWLHVYLDKGESEARRLLSLIRQAKALGFRIAYTAHNIVSHESSDIERELQLRRELVSQFDLIIAHGEVAREKLIRDLAADPARIRVMPHGTYCGYYPNVIDRASARERLGLQQDEFVFLALGAIRGYKGAVPLLDSFAAVRRDAPRSRLVIAGRILDKDVEEQVLARLGSVGDAVTFRPEFVKNDDVQVYVNACDAFVLPYERVLTSGAAMLALSFGRPIIAPRAGVLPEYVTDDIGELFTDYRQMQSIMREWYALWDSGNWAKRFHQRDFQEFCRRHDWERLVERAGL